MERVFQHENDMVRFSLWNSHSEALGKLELRRLRQAGQLQGFFNSFNLEMNEGLKVRYNNMEGG